jgi:hypothetical protein
MSDVFDVGTLVPPYFKTRQFHLEFSLTFEFLDVVGFLQTQTMQAMLGKHGSVAL